MTNKLNVGPDSDHVDPLKESERQRADHGRESSFGITRIRSAPTGLPRRDRRAWRALELERFHRETIDAASAAHGQRYGWAQGFMTNPPRGLGRRGRRAWLTTQREETKQWWNQRRASNTDIDTRAVGVLVIALLCGAALLCAILTTRRTESPPPPQAAALISPPSTIAGPLAPTGLLNGAAPAANDTLTVRSGQWTGSVPVTPAAVPPMAGGWQPAPAGGVTPIRPVPPAPIDPATVILQPAPTGPISRSDLSTPIAAVTAWLARTCPSRWKDPFGTEIRRGQPMMSTAGWNTVDPTKDTTGQRLWTQVVVPARQSRVCGDLKVQQSVDSSSARGSAFVGYTANRIVISPGHPPVVEHLVGARLVIQQSDGRWLVDRSVVGG